MSINDEQVIKIYTNSDGNETETETEITALTQKQVDILLKTFWLPSTKSSLTWDMSKLNHGLASKQTVN